MSRLTALGRTPISERIKVFDASSSPKKTPPKTPSRPRQPSVTPTVDLKPVPKGAAKEAKEPGVRGQESLRKAPEKLVVTSSVGRSDSSAGSKARLVRTDSTKAPVGSVARRGQVGSVSSPRVGKKPAAATAKSVLQNSGAKPAGAKPGTGGRAAPQKDKTSSGIADQKPKPKTITGSASVDVKPDVIADIQTTEEAIEDVNDTVPDDAVKEEAAETVTAKLITELRDEVAVSHKDLDVMLGCDVSNSWGKDHQSEMEEKQSQDQEQGLNRVNGQELGKEQEQEQEQEQAEERKMSVQEFMKDEVRKLSVQEDGDQSFLPKKSIQEVEQQTYVRKKSAVEVEVAVEQQPYIRKKSAVEVEVEAPYYRRESLTKNSTPDYRRESRQLEELKHLSDNQYFTKQALNNATSTTINQAMKLDMEYKEEAVTSMGRHVGDLEGSWKLDKEYTGEAVTSLGREMDELEGRGAGQEEAAKLKKQMHELERRLRDQEEEMDDLAGQVQQLEAGKMKLDTDLNQCKKEHRRELQDKEDELEDARAATQKKVKVLEQQLEQEHEERISFVRERHDLEGKVMGLQDLLERSGDEELVAKLKKDLKKTKALLKDAHLMLDKSQNEGTNKVIMRQLKNQLEDAEFARSTAMKSKQNAELELADVQVQLEDVSRARADLDQKNLRLSRERADLASNLQETEEDLQDVMRKYKASVSAVTTDQITIQDQAATIQSLEAERNKLREQCAEISQRLEHMDGENVSSAQHKRLELKIRELESKLELEKTTKGRLETQIQRQKEGTEKMIKEIEDLRLKEAGGQEEQKKLARTARELKEDLGTLQGKEVEVTHRKGDLEKQLEVSEAETVAVRGELKTALKRVEDLQAAISGDLDSSNSDGDSTSSDEEMSVFMDQHRRAMSVQRDRESQMRDTRVSQTREPREQFRVPRQLESVTRYSNVITEEEE